MKKIIACLLAGLLALSLGGCAAAPQRQEGEPLRVVCTLMPQYDWAREIVGGLTGRVELTLLLDNGVDLHSYQATAQDMVRLSTCDLLIYVGGESEGWVEDALRETANPALTAIRLLDVLGEDAKTEEAPEGAAHDHEEGEAEYDEHVWLSLTNAALFCRAIADALARLDAQNADAYAANARDYLARLEALDGRYRETVAAAGRDTLLFGDRFPFRYLADDYGLRCYAAFPGCSAETEASFETIAYLAAKVDELGLDTVLTVDDPQHRIAQTIVENTRDGDQRILSLNSMQSVTARALEEGVSYLSIMEDNLRVLTDALN